MAEPTKRDHEIGLEIMLNDPRSGDIANAIAAERERILAVFRELAEETRRLEDGQERADDWDEGWALAIEAATSRLEAAIRKVEWE